MDTKDVLLETFGRLRDEIISMQRTRAYLYVFKVTALGVTYYQAASRMGGSDTSFPQAQVALALAPLLAVAIDLFIQGHSYAIKEIGYYIRWQIEPILLRRDELREDRRAQFIPYEAFLVSPRSYATPRHRGHATRMVTWLSVAISSLALSPLGILGTQYTVPVILFCAWLGIVVGFVIFAFWRYKIPKEWVSEIPDESGKDGATPHKP